MPIAAAQQLLDRPGQVNHVLISNRGELCPAQARPTRSSANSARPSPRWASRRHGETGRHRDGRRAGRRLHRLVHDLRLVLDRRGILLIFLIFVMLAAERAASSDRARDRHAAAATWSRCSPFEGLLTTSRRGSSGRCSAPPSPTDGARDGGRLRRERGRWTIEYSSRRAASPSPTRSACCSPLPSSPSRRGG